MFYVNLVHIIKIRIHETNRENTLTKGFFSMLFPINCFMLTNVVYVIQLKPTKTMELV